MSEIDQTELSQLEKDYQTLLASQQTLLLSTVSREGAPHISYAPYVRDPAGAFYIYVSDLADHTANLRAYQQTSILFIRPEDESNNLFARERAIFHCNVREVGRDEDRYLQQLDALQGKFGEMVEVLRSLSDFHLFALIPKSGRYVAGFGRAFSIDLKNATLHHISIAPQRGNPNQSA